MNRQANIFAIFVICISSVLFVYADVTDADPPIPDEDFPRLKTILENSDVGAWIPDSSNVQIYNITFGYQNVQDNGTDYLIYTSITNNGSEEDCCVYGSLKENQQKLDISCLDYSGGCTFCG